MLYHSPSYGKSVKGGGTSSYLIQNNKALLGGISQYIGYFGHLHHKGRLTACKVIRSPHSCKNSVANSYIGTFRRYKGSYLCHKHYKCRLPHIGRLTCHIGAGDNAHPVLLIIEVGIIVNKTALSHDFLYYRMSSVFYIYNSLVIYHGFRKIILIGNICQRLHTVKNCNRLGSFLNSLHLICNCFSYTYKYIIFK